MAKKGMVYLEVEKKNNNVYLYIGVVLSVIMAALAILYAASTLSGYTTGLVSRKAVITEALPDPVQKAAKGEVKMTVDDYDVTITYKYSYVVDALVVHTKNYSGYALINHLSQKDLALAWGNLPMLNDSIDFHWSQSERWYYWNVKTNEEAERAGGTGYINTHSANTHIIPADDTIKKQIKDIKAGDHVVLTGYLVDVVGEQPNGERYTWNSSTSRNDTGDGACEVMYVTRVERL